MSVSEHDVASGPCAELHDQCAAEFFTLQRFFTILSRNGVRIPEDSYLLRKELESWRIRFERRNISRLRAVTWPSDHIFSLVALAQHHGVPTRALDWTSSAHVAAYFASKPVLASAGDDHIAVWAVDDFHRQDDQRLDVTSDRPLRVFTVSGADNDNLRAQRGLFMLYPQVLTGEPTEFKATEYNKLLLESLPLLNRAVQFIRVLVHHREAQRLLAYLSRHGITTGALYPGLWGAAREYEDEQQIDSSSFGTLRTLDTIGMWDQINALKTQVDANRT